MKKLILAIAVIFTAALTSCTKENVAPSPSFKASKLATGDKGNLSQADFTTPPADGDKGNLSQADGDGGH